MKGKYQNLFFIFGIIVLGVMVSQLNFTEVWKGLQHAGYWTLAVIVLWAFLYLFNTSAWYIIIRSLQKQGGQTKDDEEYPFKPIPYAWLYKVTISGFALNYATPGGLMGGEPYRVMALTPKIGAEKATASVLLYAMTHIFSHFWFWLLSCILFILTQSINVFMGILLAIVVGFCILAIWFFLSGYKKGLAARLMKLLSHIPFVKGWAKRFIEGHEEQLSTIDKQVASLHNQNPRTFISVVLLELACRVCSALEVMFILFVLFPHINFIACILIIAFTTLFANLLFFIPLQLGGREGGFLISITELGLTANAGIFVALIVRIRELIWTAIGLLLIKVEKK